MAGGKLHRGLHIVGVARNDDAQRLDLVLAGVGAVEHTTVAVETHFAINNPFQLLDEFLRLLKRFRKGGGGQNPCALWQRGLSHLYGFPDSA